MRLVNDSILLDETRGQAPAAVRVLTLNRPAQRNALSPDLIKELRAALARADADANVRCIVLTASGDKAFCAGADLGSASQAGEAGLVFAHESRRAYAQLLADLDKLSKPIIAQVNGAAFAGGLGLVCACDFAIAADDARFATPEVDVGLFPYMALAPILRCIGRRAAMELTLTGRKLHAAEAVEIGLINRSVARDQLSAEVNKLADLLASKSPVTMRLGRRAFQIVDAMPHEAALEALAGQLSINALADDAMEGISAFLEKRPAIWSGK
jgi:enoyl-CoA hydratase